jgi:hypothetical protein
MRLFESIIDANHRAVAGDASAGLHPAEFADAPAVVRAAWQAKTQLNPLLCSNGSFSMDKMRRQTA